MFFVSIGEILQINLSRSMAKSTTRMAYFLLYELEIACHKNEQNI